ncbi:type IX secretion system outer membrane channel protein PorV [Chitinophaga qingshengii]|uniref:Type IX secretion system outer membrane channel protein PorV n=1 Tax=Chitinophaga qingshengii TaxID=1569794 RepID=A0ABR7TW50_9BACT|nr:type IX secretion system outer membrane channel protein PorV [Chitinophaga qingshengii]MBC9934673.1 type IX secretion system outer membrane channel protein PorV [Chitinophaga qingshengii]
MKYGRIILLLCGMVAFNRAILAQKAGQKAPNTGASFLLINPDARSSGTGDATTGLEASPNSLFSNAAKIVFAGDWGVSANYSPWMWELNNNQSNMAYVSAYKNLNPIEGVGLSMKYFNYGDVTFRDDNGTVLQQYSPREFAVDAAYARKLGQHMSLAISLRYVRSQLGQGSFNGLQQKPASAVAGDIGYYYQNSKDKLEFGNRYSFGVSLTNIGTKLQYTDDNTRKSFLPMNLRIGGGYTFVHTYDHEFTIAVDINKLLVPTPPVYALDSNGIATDQILKGKDPNRGVVDALFSSFGDAPGGFQEELREFTIGSGIEYAYRHAFFVRTGYFYEHPNKGYRQHFSAGVGLCISNISLDIAYQIPTGESLVQKRTLKFSLVYNIGGSRDPQAP